MVPDLLKCYVHIPWGGDFPQFDGGEPQNIQGKGLMVWKKIDNEWKINKLIGLSSGEDEDHSS